MDLKETLQYYRKEKGLSQIELADVLEVSRQTISKWETGTVLPSAENLLALSQLYGVPVDTLLHGGTGEDSHSEQSAPPPTPEHPLRPRRTVLLGMLSVLFLCDLLFFFMDISWYSNGSPFASLTQLFRLLTCCIIGLCFGWLDRRRAGDKKISLLIAAAALLLGLYVLFMPTPLLWKIYDWITWYPGRTFDSFFPDNPIRWFIGWTLCESFSVSSHMLLIIAFQLGRLWFSRKRTSPPQAITEQA